MELIYSDIIDEADQLFNTWRNRIVKGKLTNSFGKRADTAMTDFKDKFIYLTMGSLSVRDRSDRLASLANYFIKHIRSLLLIQQSFLESQAFKNIRLELVSLLKSDGQYPSNMSSILDSVSQDIRIKLLDLKPAFLDVNMDEYLNELIDRLSVFANEFPSSADGKYEELQIFDKKMRTGSDESSASQDRKPRGIRFGLGLVGMLRPPGFGNFQGFVNYGASLFGIPLDIILGIENNGDTHEVILHVFYKYEIIRLNPFLAFAKR